jgi:plastocyanin
MQKSRRWAAIAFGAAVLLAVVSPARAATFRADINDFAFTPDPVLINVGDRVRWTNQGDETHSVTADDGSFDREDVDPGDTYSKTFRQPGRFPYRCTRHSGMTGVVEVGDQTGSSPGPQPAPSATTSSTSGPHPTTTRTAQQVVPTTSPPAAGSSDPATAATTLPPTARGTATMPVLRPSTTSTSAPPAADGRVTIPTGEAPVFKPTPEELSAPAPEATGGGPNGGGSADGRAADASRGADDLGWGPLVVLGIGAAGLGGLLLARRTRRH